MKNLLLASTVFVAVDVSAHAQSLIAPGQGTVTDASGTQWQITTDGSILETLSDGSQVWTPGGGGTAALTIAGGVVYGQDARTQAWLTLSDDAWAPATAPAAVAAEPGPPAAQAASQPFTAAVPDVSAAAPSTVAPSSTIGPCPTDSAGAPSNIFHVVGGQIIGPTGQPFVAKGINAGVTNFGDAAQMLTDFPGLNFVRASDNAYSPPSTFASFVSTMTARGVVVEIEDHRDSNGGGSGGEQGVVETGATLATEQAWFASLAQAFKGNPYVWLGTNNEPPGPGAALAQWITTTYQTIRSNGFTNPIMMDAIGAFDTTGMPQNFASSFTNVIWDGHYYPWYYVGNNETAAQGLQQIVSSLQAIPSSDGTIPVIVAEYGMCTSSGDTEQQGMDLVGAVANSASTSPQTTSGASAWHWGETDVCNNLVFGGASAANQYTGAVQIYVGTDPTAAPQAAACQMTATGAQPLSTEPDAPLPAPTVAAATAAANALGASAAAALASNPSLVQQAQAALQATQGNTAQ